MSLWLQSLDQCLSSVASPETDAGRRESARLLLAHLCMPVPWSIVAKQIESGAPPTTDGLFGMLSGFLGHLHQVPELKGLTIAHLLALALAGDTDYTSQSGLAMPSANHPLSAYVSAAERALRQQPAASKLAETMARAESTTPREMATKGCNMNTVIAAPLGIAELKPHIDITASAVECPVKGCSTRVKRQTKIFLTHPDFVCPVHRIAISPSTFEYPSEAANILNTESGELQLLESIRSVKRESRIKRDRSEDAVTWNVFRSLSNAGTLTRWLTSATGTDVGKVEDVIYWSYSTAESRQWQELNEARLSFGESIQHGSEPDVAVVTERAVFFIECKLDATNKTSGTGQTLQKRLGFKHYIDGAGGWFGRVFASDYQSVVMNQRYELLRFWLLGSWLAEQKRRDFHLLLLLRRGAEPDILTQFSALVRMSAGRVFGRQDWEDVYRAVESTVPPDRRLLAYMANKTLGYDSDGKLRKAFAV